VSLTENYYEDENYYNPALPAPRFANAKAMGSMDGEPYTDEACILQENLDFVLRSSRAGRRIE